MIKAVTAVVIGQDNVVSVSINADVAAAFVGRKLFLLKKFKLSFLAGRAGFLLGMLFD